MITTCKWSFYIKYLNIEISYPKQEFQSNSKFIYETTHFNLGGTVNTDNDDIIRFHSDDVAVLLKDVMDVVEEDITDILMEDGVSEGDALTYSQSLIPFSTHEFVGNGYGMKHKINTPYEEDYLKTSLLTDSLNQLHIKIEGSFEQKPYAYDIHMNAIKLKKSYHELSDADRYKLNEGIQPERTFKITKGPSYL